VIPTCSPSSSIGTRPTCTGIWPDGWARRWPNCPTALFEAATKIDGLTVDPHAEDIAGQPGIKISWNRNGYSGEFIIDAKTYAYLGSEGSALLQMSIVDKAGH
jgi:hypothetical protein